MKAKETFQPDSLLDLFTDALVGAAGITDFSVYQDDPVGFCEKVFGEEYTDDVKKMMRSVRDNEVTVATSANATGKTHAAARVALWFYKCFDCAKVFTTAAPPFSNLETILWGEILDALRKAKSAFSTDFHRSMRLMSIDPSRVLDEDTDQSIKLLKGLTVPVSANDKIVEASFSGKHAPNMLFIYDEGDAVPDACYKGQESCSSGGLFRTLVMFNPRQKLGAVYRMIRDRRCNNVRLSAFNHPNVVEGREVISGAVNRNTTVRRLLQWSIPLSENERPDHECYAVPDFLVGATAVDQRGEVIGPLLGGHRRVIESSLWYMVLGEYPPQATSQLISEEWVNRARTRWDSYVAKYGQAPPKGVSAAVGLDVGEYGNDPSNICFRYGGFVSPLIEWRSTDPDLVATQAGIECKQRDVFRIGVDSTGVGASVAPKLIRLGFPAHRVMAASSPSSDAGELGEFEILRDELWWLVREWLRTDPGAMLPPDQDLLEELTIVTYSHNKRNGKIMVMAQDVIKDHLGRSPNRADALRHTFYEPELLYPDLA